MVWRARFARKNEHAQTNKVFKQNPAGFNGGIQTRQIARALPIDPGKT
jgi:hypothetical protein